MTASNQQDGQVSIGYDGRAQPQGGSALATGDGDDDGAPAGIGGLAFSKVGAAVRSAVRGVI